jgi:hypothetical protein
MLEVIDPATRVLLAVHRVDAALGKVTGAEPMYAAYREVDGYVVWTLYRARVSSAGRN